MSQGDTGRDTVATAGIGHTARKPVALVTGASRGLGRAVALQLAANGVHVVALARTVGGLEEVDDEVQELGGSASLAVADLKDRRAIQSVLANIGARWGQLNLLVHCAIFAPPLTPASQISRSDLARAIAVNYTASCELIRGANPLLGQIGVAVFIDDPDAGRKFFGCYGSSKMAQITLAKCWKQECRKIGPRVIIFSPRPMYTRTRLRFAPGSDPHLLSTPDQEARNLMEILRRKGSVASKIRTQT